MRLDGSKARLSFDPGHRCGWAKWEHGHYSAGIVDGEDAVGLLLAQHKTGRLGSVVVEDIVGGGIGWPELQYTLRLVGRIQGACQVLGVRLATHTTQVKDPFIKTAEVMLGKKHTKHASDDCSALAHLLAFEWRMSHT